MGSLNKYIVLIISLGLLVGCGTTFGTTQQTVDIETPQITEIGLPARPETLSDIQALLQSDGEDCQLPCFWGFRPEQSTEDEVLDFLQPQAVGSNVPELIYYFTDPESQERLFSLNFGTQDQLVKSISVIIREPDSWLPTETLQLTDIISAMPSEPEIYFSINLSQRRYFLTLAYNEGVLADYAFELQVEGGVVSQNIDNPFLFCPTLDRTELIDLDLANADAQTLLENSGTQQFISMDLVWTIECMTGLSVDEFIQQVIENPDECIELPSYPELIEMGYEF
jgi:hypothetical protein